MENETDSGAVILISDFSNVSDTVLRLTPEYGVLNGSGSLFVSPTPDVTIK